MKIAGILLVTVASLGIVQGAHAQSSESIVMRRPLDPKTRTYAWIPTEWSQCSNSCGPGQQKRSVQCVMNGKLGAPEVNCTPERPTDAQSCYGVEGCSFTWQEGDWADVEGCGDVVQTRTLSCLRADGRTVANEQCAQPAPDTTRAVRDLRSCSYSWKAEDWNAWSDFCKTGADRSRDVYCLRSNGERVQDALCGTAGPKPVASEKSDRYEQCGYAWDSKDWGAWSATCKTGAERSREVVCRRSNGDVVSDAMCSATGAKPAVSETGDRYEGCAYTWRAGEFGAFAPACGTSVRTRSVDCLRSNGDVVGDTSCDAAQKPAVSEVGTDYSTCSYDWKPGDWSAPSSACGAATSTRSVACGSSDGRMVEDAFCKTARPEVSKATYETSGCSQTWKTDAWSSPAAACGATVQSRSVWCLRSDGQTVADASCNAAARPPAQQAAISYATCSYAWDPAAWSDPSTTCGQATYSRAVTCLSSDGRTVDPSSCSGTKPDETKSDYRTDGCGYAWKTASTWDSPVPACGPTVQNRPVTCLRSDGVTVADASCPVVTRPSGQQPATDYSTCTYGWTASSYGEWSATCGSATQTRTVSCQSSDGRTVADSFCTAGSRPAASQTSYQTSGCARTWTTGAWSAPDAGCSAAAVQTRGVSCLRSDGQTVADVECTSAKPAASQTVANYASCQPYWYDGSGWSDWNSHCSANATRTRAISCFRLEQRCVSGTPEYWGPASGTDCYRRIPNSQCAAYPTATREGYDPSMNTQTAAVYDQCGYAWQTGAFGAPAAACGATTQTRSVTCLRSDGTTVADASCTSARPAAQQAATDYSTCSYSWSVGAFGAQSTTCGSSTQTRSVTCLRSDGTTVADGSCASAGSKPSTTQTSYQTSGCGRSWTAGAWSAPDAGCSAAAVQTRSVSCLRSDGQTVSDAECTAAKPAASQTVANYASCQPYWYDASGWSDWNSHCSANATRTRAIGCFRLEQRCVVGSADYWGPATGTDCYRHIANAECTAYPTSTREGYSPSMTTQSAAVYDQCGYSWQATGWGAAAPACGASTQSRSVFCQRSDGTTVADSSCSAGTRPATVQGTTDYSACGYNWIWNGWTTTAQVCGSVSQARSVVCQRGDGTIVADGYCTAAKPATTQSYADYSSCSYAAVNPGAWTDYDSACSASATRHRYYQCRRSDGAIVAGAECVNRGIGVDEAQTGANYTNACPGYYVVGAWSDYSSHCSAGATRTRSATCYRSGDNLLADDAYCNSRGTATPARSESAGVYDQCSYAAVNPGAWTGWDSGCSANATRHRYYQCQRADGAIVAGAECVNRGIGVDEAQTGANYASCTYYGGPWWGNYRYSSTCSANAVRYEDRTCFRSDGTPMSTGDPCVNSGVPVTQAVTVENYSGCGYAWQASGYSVPSGCGEVTAVQDVWCQRSDGARVGEGSCGGGRPANSTQTTDYGACGYAWYQSGFSPQTNQCGTAYQTQTVFCRRSDGAQVDSSVCGGGKPATSSPYTNYNACGYTAYYGAFGECQSNSQQTQSMNLCQRSDGASVAGEECVNRGQPWTRSQACTYGTWRWRYNGSGAYSAAEQTSVKNYAASVATSSQYGWYEFWNNGSQYKGYGSVSPPSYAQTATQQQPIGGGNAAYISVPCGPGYNGTVVRSVFWQRYGSNPSLTYNGQYVCNLQ